MNAGEFQSEEELTAYIRGKYVLLANMIFEVEELLKNHAGKYEVQDKYRELKEQTKVLYKEASEFPDCNIVRAYWYPLLQEMCAQCFNMAAVNGTCEKIFTAVYSASSYMSYTVRKLMS